MTGLRGLSARVGCGHEAGSGEGQPLSYGPEPPAPCDMTTRRGPPLAISPPAATVCAGGRPARTPGSGFNVADAGSGTMTPANPAGKATGFRAP
jgi:hypothetical protein